jgi:hypothetical protein
MPIFLLINTGRTMLGLELNLKLPLLNLMPVNVH